jgi:hypothetical protein
MKKQLFFSALFLLFVSVTNMHAMDKERRERIQKFNAKYDAEYLANTKKKMCAVYTKGEYGEVSAHCASLAEFFKEFSQAEDGSCSVEYAEIAQLWNHRAFLCLQQNRPMTCEYFLQAYPSNDDNRSILRGQLDDPFENATTDLIVELENSAALKSKAGSDCSAELRRITTLKWIMKLNEIKDRALPDAHKKKDYNTKSKLCGELAAIFKTVAALQNEPVISQECKAIEKLWEHRRLLVLGNNSPSTVEYLCQAFPKELPQRKNTR